MLVWNHICKRSINQYYIALWQDGRCSNDFCYFHLVSTHVQHEIYRNRVRSTVLAAGLLYCGYRLDSFPGNSNQISVFDFAGIARFIWQSPQQILTFGARNFDPHVFGAITPVLGRKRRLHVLPNEFIQWSFIIDRFWRSSLVVTLVCIPICHDLLSSVEYW